MHGNLTLVAVMVTAFLVAGCGTGRAYPVAAPASALGRAANCDACGKSIDAVAREHLLDFQGVQYTVCNTACAEKLKDDVVHERHVSHDHGQ